MIFETGMNDFIEHYVNTKVYFSFSAQSIHRVTCVSFCLWFWWRALYRF